MQVTTASLKVTPVRIDPAGIPIQQLDQAFSVQAGGVCRYKEADLWSEEQVTLGEGRHLAVPVPADIPLPLRVSAADAERLLAAELEYVVLEAGSLGVLNGYLFLTTRVHADHRGTESAWEVRPLLEAGRMIPVTTLHTHPSPLPSKFHP